MDENSMTVNLDWFKDDGIFLPMLNDTGRNVFYKSAIEQHVAGRTVVDIGAGTGLLSVLAVKAGASHVWAVEQDANRAQLAQDFISKIGLSSVIEVVHADFLDTNLPADYYVSETINTQIFGENILQLAEHARKHNGIFIPGQFKVWVEIYDNHPIFPLCQARSDAYEFQPDIDIDPEFEKKLKNTFDQSNSLNNTLYRANILNGLFHELHKFTDLKLTRLRKFNPITVDLNQLVDINNIKFEFDPADIWPSGDDIFNNDPYMVLCWKAVSGPAEMHSADTWFGNVAKILRRSHRTANAPVKIWYDHSITDWRLSY